MSDEEWAFVVPYVTLLPVDADQRTHDLREVFNATCWIVRTGAPWRYLPNDFPPWEAVDQQTQRWIKAGSFEAIVHDARALLRVAQGRAPEPSAVILDGRTLQSTPESGGRAGYDGHRRKKGSKVHMAVDTLGHLLALLVTPAHEQERAHVEELAEAVQEVTGEHVEVAFVDQGYTGMGGRRSGPGARDAPRGSQAEYGKTGLRLGRALPSPGPRLRTTARNAHRFALRGVCRPAVASGCTAPACRFITRSSPDSRIVPPASD